MEFHESQNNLVHEFQDELIELIKEDTEGLAMPISLAYDDDGMYEIMFENKRKFAPKRDIAETMYERYRRMLRTQ